MEGYQASRGPMYPNQSAQGPNEVVKVLPVHPTLHLTSTVTPHVLDILPWCFLDSRQDIGISLKAALWGRLFNCLNRKLSMQSQLFKLKKNYPWEGSVAHDIGISSRTRSRQMPWIFITYQGFCQSCSEKYLWFVILFCKVWIPSIRFYQVAQIQPCRIGCACVDFSFFLLPV